jgi:hypothetical protein
MLLNLVRVMTAYATRAEEWERAEARAAAGKGPAPDPKWETALRVTNNFDAEGRDKIIFSLLNNADDALKISAMECLSKVGSAPLTLTLTLALALTLTLALALTLTLHPHPHAEISAVQCLSEVPSRPISSLPSHPTHLV